LDSFDIHLWSVQTGQLLDQLSGHEGPVSSLAFAPNGGTIISGSWDHTVRLWSVFGRTQTSEPLHLQADVLCVAFRPDSKQLAVSTLDGQLTFWSASEATQVAELDARRDASGGRRLTDRRTAANVAGTKSFNHITYSGDGACLLAGGNSKYICLYDVQSGVLLKKFTVSVNLSLDGTQDFLNSRHLTEAGPRALLDDDGDVSDAAERRRRNRTLPGARRGGGDLSSRSVRADVRVTAVAFAPTGRAFCAASTEGLLVYSLDPPAAAAGGAATGAAAAGGTVQFDPFDLDVTVTPASTLAALAARDYVRALVMAFRLNLPALVRRVYEGTPAAGIGLVVRALPAVYVGRLLRFAAHMAEDSPHLEFNLRWIKALLTAHGRGMREQRGDFDEALRLCMRAVARIRDELTRL
jgi:periodic tryptophan protein 2